MVLLGLLLILVAAAALIEVSVNDTANTMPVTVLDRTFHLSPFELFIAGVATTAVFFIGLLMVTGGLRRAAVKRRRRREARLAERDRVSRLEAEKRDLERRLETTPATPATTATTATTATVDRDRDGVDDRDETAPAPATRPLRRPDGVVVDRDGDGVDDRDETAPATGRHHVSVPAQQSGDRLVAGSPSADDPGRRI
ncbi:hypothetical protein GCM10009530_07560 [Microbispora corallina]|uniref:Lipopolysaccharide assembly protein A domain-containing protein n=1 Tax=Microbispora corallina TaxID=83302 RepID=A0ABQ4FV81_9ACTN|nr:hypothetical protein [Microbispora corallina]GIH38719.1 hypothetical protein Mco01_17190 [Microbispora corallina]